MARSIVTPYHISTDEQARALADIAQAMARAGELKEAEEVARSITDMDSKAAALASVAIALAQVGEAQSAARVTAALCSMGEWSTAMAPAFLLAPSAFTGLTPGCTT